MPNARTRTTRTPAVKDVTPEDERASLLLRIIDHAYTLPTQAAIADMLGVSGKTGRGRSRAGALKHSDGDAIPAFHASKDGAKPPTRVVEGWCFTYAPTDLDALRALAARVTPAVGTVTVVE